MRAPVHMRGPDGKMRPVGASEEARKERKERLQALVGSPGWEMVRRGLQQHLRRIEEHLATGAQLELWEVRAHQGCYRVLTELERDPVGFLLKFDESET